MDSNLQEAMLAMSIEAAKAPFVMPDTPEYSSSQVNIMSIMGRLLNPDCQKISSLILDMPRKWQLYHRVRGIALSKDRFQFIFKYQHDLEDVLVKGVQSFNEWTIVLDRWLENPPSDYLQHILVWVQIKNIPVNHRTVKAITTLGEFAGEVCEVAFDPDKAQTQPFARVLVRFNVNNSLRLNKVVTLPDGSSTTVSYHYERIQKRCFACQRLTHMKDVCPFLIQHKKEVALATNPVPKTPPTQSISTAKTISLLPEDPLFGILSDEQVGIDPISGRPKIAPEVLEEMRNYLLVPGGDDISVRISRIKSSLSELDKDPVGQKTILRLEAAPTISRDINKEKGLVFDYGLKEKALAYPPNVEGGSKLLASAIVSGQAMSRIPLFSQAQSECQATNFYSSPHPSSDSSTVMRTSNTDAGSSGAVQKQPKTRRRPYKTRRGRSEELKATISDSQLGVKTPIVYKRKASDKKEIQPRAARRKSTTAPNEGLSPI